jgi:hypothetical protein
LRTARRLREVEVSTDMPWAQFSDPTFQCIRDRSHAFFTANLRSLRKIRGAGCTSFLD